MERTELQDVLEKAASERGCRLVALSFDDDNNVFDATVASLDGEALVSLDDCEYVHRAVLAAFDRNIEDYALTVGSDVFDAALADDILKNANV
ncbi:MAG: hypothetical protein MJY44_05545 [Bacteroidales bacterium]|nr:hypothetical protein [Bacteroidales bacterium]